MASKLKYPTEQGELQYPWIEKPDIKFDENGVYKTDISIPSEDAKDLVAKIKEFAKDELGKKAEKAHMPFKMDETNGNVVFRTKSNYAPLVVDSQGDPIVQNLPRIRGGTVAKVKVEISSYDKGANYGVRLNLKSVQLIKLVEGTADDGDRFEKVEGGYVAPKADLPASSSDDDASDNDGYDF